MVTDPVRLDQRELSAVAVARATAAPGGISDVDIAIDHELITVRSRMAKLAGLTVVHGASTARRNLLLHVRDASPAIALHVTLRGSAHPHIDARAPGEKPRVGEWLVFSGHVAHDVAMDRDVANDGLRINFTRRHLDTLAMQYPQLLEGEAGRVLSCQAPALLRAEPMPLGPLVHLVETLRHSQHYGDLRRVFLESTAHSMLVMALSGRRTERLPMTVRARERMLDVRAHLLENMRAPPTLASLARMVGTNEFQLKRDFKTLFGEPVYAFVLGRRLDHARALLLDSDRSVKEIAAEVGYTHVAHFSAAFRKRFGVPPTALRGHRVVR